MVTQTSISAYYGIKTKDGQLEKIARFLIEETKHGRPHSIETIARHFMKSGDIALMQTGRVSARLNRIKDGDRKNAPGVEVDGKKYVLELVKTDINPETGRANKFYWLVLAKPTQAIQTQLF